MMGFRRDGGVDPRTSDFVLSLGLDDMNMAKFTPFPGAPLWKTIREEGAFEEDWRQMNCSIRLRPKAIASGSARSTLQPACEAVLHDPPGAGGSGALWSTATASGTW